EFLEVHGEPPGEGGIDHYQRVAAAGGGLARLMLAVDDMEGTAESLGEGGFASAMRDVRRDDGSRIGAVLTPVAGTPAGVELGFIAYELDAAARFASRRQRGLFDHGFPLKRLDHLAVIPPDAAAAETFWDGVF